MAHFIGKYFTYHAVLWDDRAAGEVEQRVTGQLAYSPRWGARHIGAGGGNSWATLATGGRGKESASTGASK
jgi:hypothetical protein